MSVLIVISSPQPIRNESDLINSLFDEGLELFHLRKPGSEKDHLRQLLDNIRPEHWPKIAFHDHHDLLREYDSRRLHFKEDKRKAASVSTGEVFIRTTSTHNLTDAISLSNEWSYVFLSPLFNSISKPGYRALEIDDFSQLSQKKTKVVALGGIDHSNVRDTLSIGFDGVAVLGAIWNQPKNILSNFKSIQKQCHEIDLMC